jgi:hypothetical protein
MTTWYDLCHQHNIISTTHIPHIFSWQSLGYRFRDSNGDVDAGIAQTSNSTLAFYPPNNIEANGFTWLDGTKETIIMTLDNSGNLNCVGDVTGFNQDLSDSNFKTNVTPFQEQDWKPIITNLTPVTYTWAENTPLEGKKGTNDIGLIAQEVSDVFPLAHNKKELAGQEVQIVKYEKLITILLAAVQSHEHKIAELEERLNSL